MIMTHGPFFSPLHPTFYQNYFSVACCQFTIQFDTSFVDYSRFQEEASRCDIASVASVLKFVVSKLY